MFVFYFINGLGWKQAYNPLIPLIPLPLGVMAVALEVQYV